MVNSKTLFIATNNQEKIKELTEKTSSFFSEILTPKDIDGFEPDENGTTYIENALIKARYWHKKTGLPTLSDDSGLNILALDNWPGVDTAPFSKQFPSYYDAKKHIFEKLLPFNNKDISFICTLAYIDSSSTEFLFEGRIDGTFTFPPNTSDGYAYDDIFTPKNYNKTIAELGKNWKKTYSHRAKALDAWVNFLKKD